VSGLFLAVRYIQQLRAETVIEDAGIPVDALEALASPRLLVRGSGRSPFLRRIAYLWCGALLDMRFDTLLLPVLARVRDLEVPLDALLNRRNREFGWGLPDDFFPERLASGACLVMLDGIEEGPQRVQSTMAAYPLCRFIVSSGADGGDAGAGESGFDFGGPQARCIVIHGERV
jgi:hypothetical protein